LTVVLKKRINLPLAFFMKNRTGAVKQNASRLEPQPQCIEKPLLLGHELRNIGLSPEPTDIGVAAYDP
jgi:hypothetical protein